MAAVDLVDFDNAIRGIREYEFVSVGIHMSRGDSRFLRRVLTAYGYTRGQLDREFRQRLLAWAILHRHSNLTTWLRKLPGPGRPTLASLADRWFTTESGLRHLLRLENSAMPDQGMVSQAS